MLNPLLYKKLSYDPAGDFRMLALVTEVPVVLCVHPSVPAKTVAEFVAYAKQNPGKLNFGSAGTGGFIHLAAEMFKQMAGIEMTHVPYKGAAPALIDLHVRQHPADVRLGQHGVAFDPLGNAAAAWHQFGAKRHPELPDVPTIAESGYPDYFVSVWNAIAVPAGTAGRCGAEF